MDSAWGTLIGGAIGVVGTLGATGFAQWRSDVRESARRTEDRERERETRLFDHRRIAVEAVIEHYYRWTSTAWLVAIHAQPEPPEDAMEGFWEATGRLDLYADEATSTAASNLYWALQKMVFGPFTQEDQDAAMDVQERFEDFLDAARSDVGAPPRGPRQRLEIKFGPAQTD